MALPSPQPIVSPGALEKSVAFGESIDLLHQAQTSHALEAFVNVVERLESVLDSETQMLNRSGPIVLHDFNFKKSHGLLELSRTMSAIRALDRSGGGVDAKAPLARLRAKLERNLASLQTHLMAVGEIAAIIARAIQDHESDGTYTVRRHRKGDPR